MQFIIISLFLSSVFAFGPNCKYNKPNVDDIHVDNNDMPANFKVAFIGDQALGVNPIAVLNDLLDWGAQAILHQGDFDYVDDPDAWDEQINSVLGEDFPYFASLGNHDFLRRDGYQEKISQRLARIPEAICSGDVGLSSVCAYKGMLFTLNGMGLSGEGHEEYVDEIFAANPDTKWKICSWHNNHHDYQVGNKPTSVSLEMYETCLRYGAIVATGHEHSYARTHLMSSFADFEIASTSNTLVLEEGESFAFCQGLGGRDIRDYSGNEREDWWAATAAGDDGVSYGALKCTFNINGNLSLGSCFFDDIRGAMWDSFNIVNNVGTNTTANYGGVKKLACGPHHTQTQLSSACSDVNEIFATVNDESSVSMKFKLNVAHGEIIDEAYLEVLGLKELSQIATTDSVIKILVSSASQSSIANKMNLMMCDQTYTSIPASVVSESIWNMTLTELDEPVWKTSDIATQLQQIVDSKDWISGNEIIIELKAFGNQNRSVAFRTSNDSTCHAPTLSVFIKNHCF